MGQGAISVGRLMRGQQLFQRRAAEVRAAGLLIGVGEGEQVGFAEELAGEGDRAGLVVRALVAVAVGDDDAWDGR